MQFSLERASEVGGAQVGRHGPLFGHLRVQIVKTLLRRPVKHAELPQAAPEVSCISPEEDAVVSTCHSIKDLILKQI